MQTSRVLIVEDEPKVAGFIKQGLESSGYEIDVAYDGLEGRKMALNNNYDGLILDINLPLMNGFDLCKEVRSHNLKMPILMLSALGATDDKLNGFDLGADDYLVKPFELRELLARLKAIIKRSSPTEAKHGVILRIADLELNSDTRIATRAGKKIELTAKEYGLLEYLMLNKGRVISKAEIAEKIWQINFNTGTNVIEVYINFLRRKIDKDFSPKLLFTNIGMGYVLKEE